MYHIFDNSHACHILWLKEAVLIKKKCSLYLEKYVALKFAFQITLDSSRKLWCFSKCTPSSRGSSSRFKRQKIRPQRNQSLQSVGPFLNLITFDVYIYISYNNHHSPIYIGLHEYINIFFAHRCVAPEGNKVLV